MEDKYFSTKNIVKVFSSNIFSLSVVAITGIILPRLLGPQALGRLNSFLALALIVFGISNLGMRSSILMHLGKGKLDTPRVMGALIYVYPFSFVLSTLAILFFLLFVSDEPYPVSIVILVCLINPSGFVISYFSGYFLSKGKIHLFNRMQWGPKLAYLFAVLLLVGWFRFGVKGAIMATLLSNIIVIALAVSKIKTDGLKKGLQNISWQAALSLSKIGVVYALALMLVRLNFRIDILILKRLSDIAEVGYYSLGVNLAETIWQIPIAIGLVLMTYSANSDNQARVASQLCATLRISLLMVTVAALLLFALAPYLVPFIFGNTFNPSVAIIRTILPGIVLFIVLQIMNSQFVGTGRPYLTIFALFPSLVINIVLNFILIPQYKGIGAAMATNISYLFGSLLMVIVYSKVYKLKIRDIFTYKKYDFTLIMNQIRKMTSRFY